MPNYVQFTNNKDMVKVGCKHKGRMVYGVPKCHPSDTFNYTQGYEIAKSRLDKKILELKENDVYNKIRILNELQAKVSGRLRKLWDDYADILDKQEDLTERLERLVTDELY